MLRVRPMLKLIRSLDRRARRKEVLDLPSLPVARTTHTFTSTLSFFLPFSVSRISQKKISALVILDMKRPK